MNLRYKLTLLAIALFASSILVFYITSQVVLVRSYQNLEIRYIDASIDRAKAALNFQVKALSEKARDWAVWDDTYEYIQNQNQRFLDSNINSTTFANLQINGIIIINEQGTVVHASGYDLEVDNPLVFSENDILTILRQNNLSAHALKDGSTDGLINLSRGAALVSSQPILPSDKQGKIRGALIMIRFIDSTLLRSISDLVKMPTEMIAIGRTDLSPQLQTIKHTLEGGENIYFEINGKSDDIIAYSFVRDTNGEAAAMIKITKPYEIKPIGTQAIRFYSATIAIYIVIALLITLWVINRLIIRRLVKLTDTIELINKHENKSTRVVVRGDDEISELARSFNRMMDKFEHD